MGASTKQGLDIANKSREIVREKIANNIKNLSKEEQDIVERIVHSTADTEYAKLISFHNNFVEASLKAIKNNEDILTDINMVKAGINKNYKGKVECFISEPSVIKIAKEKEITRAAAAIEYAAKNGFEGIIAIGNAPTALYKAMKLFEDDKINLKSIVGVPVGFVGAADSKEDLAKTNIPSIVTNGPKGGTSVCVGAINSLISLASL